MQTTTNAYAALEREATARARSQRTETPGIYVQDSTTRLTPERAVADALESNPEAYTQFRDRHNASALVSQLQKAGIRIG